MAEIPEEKIAEIRDRLDIVAVIGRSVALKQAGRSWRGLCPFHQEKTPSFHVDPDKKLYHCFGCKAGGDVFRFMMEYEGHTFPEALRSLAAEVGVVLPEPESEGTNRALEAYKRRKKELQEANEKAAHQFSQWLICDPAAEAGRQYIRARSVEQAVAKRFGLGYAPLRNDLRQKLVDAGVSDSAIQEAGLLAMGDRGLYPRFRGRLMVPIRDLDGHTIAFGARLVEGDHPAKYLNSPETPLYSKSKTLYGLGEARGSIRREGKAFVVEGYFDVIALVQAGISNVVATCGTALTEDHLHLLSRHTRDIYLVFDADSAGMEAVKRTYETASAVPGIDLMVVALSKGDDPDSFVRKKGADAFVATVQQARPLVEVLIECCMEGVDQSVEGRVRAIDRVKGFFQRIDDPLVYRLYVQRVADRLQIGESSVIQRLKSGLSVKNKNQNSHRVVSEDEDVGSPLPGDEEALCLLLMEQPMLLDNSLVESVLGELVDERTHAIVVELLDEWRGRRQVDVGALLERVLDRQLRSRCRDHIAQMSNMSVCVDEVDSLEEATRKLELIFGRLSSKANARRKKILARQTSAILDPVERAKRIQALRSAGRGEGN